MDNKLPITTYDGSLFTWFQGAGCAVISDLPSGNLCSRIWNDACDVGFFITSPRSGRRELFTLVKEELRDDEIVAWHFESYRHDSRNRRVKVTVYND